MDISSNYFPNRKEVLERRDFSSYGDCVQFVESHYPGAIESVCNFKWESRWYNQKEIVAIARDENDAVARQGTEQRWVCEVYKNGIFEAETKGHE